MRWKIPLLLVLCIACSLAVPDTIKYTGAAARLPNMELGFAILIYETSAADSVGDSMYVEFEGRNNLGATVTGLASTTAWQKIYFNMVSCPNFGSPATYPSVDSIVKIQVPDSAWVHLPTISTPLFDQIRAKVTVTNGNSRPLSTTNSKIFMQIHQRKETPFGKPVYKTLSSTLTGP